MNNIVKYLKNHTGSTLMLTLITFAILAILGMAILAVSSSHLKMTTSERDYQAVYYIAEAGLNQRLSEVKGIVEEVRNTTSNEADFFNELDTELDSPVLFKDIFEKSYGNQPQATVTIDEKITTPNSKAYIIESVGELDGRKRIAKSEFIVTWNKSQAGSSGDFFEQVFVYGNEMKFNGNEVNGEDSTVLVTGDFKDSDLNGGAKFNVKNIYIDGNATVNAGNKEDFFGAKESPGIISITGGLTAGGNRDMYGDIWVGEDAHIGGSTRIHQSVHIEGDAEFGGGISFGDNVYVGGDASFKGSALTLNEGKSVYVKGNANFEGGVKINGHLYIEGNVNIQGSVEINGNLFIEGDANITGNPKIKGDLLYVGGNVTELKGVVEGDTYIGGDAANVGSTCQGSVFVGGKAMFIWNALIQNNLYIARDLTIEGGNFKNNIYVGYNADLVPTVFVWNNGNIDKNVYVVGNVKAVDWIAPGGVIEYTGSVDHPHAKRIKKTTILLPEIPFDAEALLEVLSLTKSTIIAGKIPNIDQFPEYDVSAHPEEWYTSKGYTENGQEGTINPSGYNSPDKLYNNMKIFGEGDYIASTPNGSAYTYENVVIVRKQGDIILKGTNSKIYNGVLIALDGYVQFEGVYFEGVIISKKGVELRRGDSIVNFKNINEIFPPKPNRDPNENIPIEVLQKTGGTGGEGSGESAKISVIFTTNAVREK